MPNMEAAAAMESPQLFDPLHLSSVVSKEDRCNDNSSTLGDVGREGGTVKTKESSSTRAEQLEDAKKAYGRRALTLLSAAYDAHVSKSLGASPRRGPAIKNLLYDACVLGEA